MDSQKAVPIELPESKTLYPLRNRVPVGIWTAAVIGLLGVTAVWGSTFIIIQNSIARMPVFSFLAWRFMVAAFSLHASHPTVLRRLARRDIQHGVILGLALSGGYITQTIGLQHTPAAVSGFITGLLVIFTPLFSWILLRRRPTIYVWLGTLMTTAGLALITLSGVAFGIGEILTLACAALFALHVIGLGEWSASRNGVALTQVQISTVALVCIGISIFQGLTIPHGVNQWSAIVFTGILATAGAYFIQTWAQAHLSTAQTSVLLTMEPVFAALFAVALGKQPLDASIIIGGGLMVAAMYVVDTRGIQHGPSEDQSGCNLPTFK